MPPALSIVIVSWNTAQMTVECLQSIAMAPGSERFQVIVVDNASTDGSPDRIRSECPSVDLVEAGSNLGFAAANNLGFRRCEAAMILLLNSDTLVLGDVLQASVAYLDSHRDVGAMGCRVLNADRTVQLTCSSHPSLLNMALMSSGIHRLPLPWVGRYLYRGWKRDSERDVDVITGCYLLIRRSILDSIGPLDERFFFCGEETDWCLRIRKAGHRTVFAPVGEIVHFGNASGAKLSWKREVLLSAGLVKLESKHEGRLRGLAMFAILWLHSALRAAALSIVGVVARSESARAKSVHFWRVAREFDLTWTNPKGTS